jgi:type I restriction enzyme, R subunit
LPTLRAKTPRFKPWAFAEGSYRVHIGDLHAQVDACVELLEDLKIRADFINKLRSFYGMLGLLEHRPEVPGDVVRDAKLLGFINKVAANLYRDPGLNLFGVAEKVKSLINAHVSARGVDPKIPPTAITDAEFEKVLQAQGSSRARAAQMQHAARYHIIGFSNQNPAYARKMSERLEEILQRFKDDWNALERELKRFIDELRQGDRNDFPNLDAKVQVPFVRLVLEECSKGRERTAAQREQALTTTLDMVEHIRQEVRKVGFWKNEAMRELLTKALVRDLNKAGVCRPGGERDLAQRLVALDKENHENLTRAWSKAITGRSFGRRWAAPCPTGRNARMPWPIKPRSTSYLACRQAAPVVD